MHLQYENKQERKTMRKNLKSMRKTKNWTLKQLSEITGIDEKLLIDIETGRNYDAKSVAQLCSLYHIRPHERFSQF